ncbi:Dickkopf-related protein 3 [Exaiptasia diaphana]|nr:Dickkopf-related protein 3 [Exaiptasia diaphana]
MTLTRQYLFRNMANMFSPLGYRSQFSSTDEVEECNVNKACLADQFCDFHVCRSCLRENLACHFIGTCCKGLACQYGRCTKNVQQGSPGTYCDKASDCDSSSCCIREISVNPKTSVCKPMLDEYESCGPINLFRQIYNGGKVEPACGPCKPGLQCKNVGTIGLHFVCLKEEET